MHGRPGHIGLKEGNLKVSLYLTKEIKNSDVFPLEAREKQILLEMTPEASPPPEL